MPTPDVRPVGDLPNEVGKTASRALQAGGIDSLVKVSQHTEQHLLAIHGVGPKAIRVLRAALTDQGLAFRQDAPETVSEPLSDDELSEWGGSA